MEEKGNSWYSAEHNGSAPANEQEQGSQQQGVGCATLTQDAALNTETSHNPQGTNSNSTSKALGTTIRAMPRKVNVVLFTHHPETLSLRTTALHLITVNPWRKEMIPQSERHT